MMLDKLKHTVKHTAIFALGNVSSKLSGFILLPIYTQLISVTDYGVLGLLEVVELFATHILSFSLQQALLRWHGLSDSELRTKNYIFTIFVFLLFASILSLIVVIPGRQIISEFLFENSVFGEYFVYLFTAITFTILSKVPFTLLRCEEKSLHYTIWISAQFAINLAANIYLVAILKLGVKGILISQTISTGLIFISFLPYLVKRMNPRFESGELRIMLRFSSPLTFAAIAATVLNLGDRYLLTKLSTLHEVGLYSLGFKISNVLKVFFVDAFTLGLPVMGWRIIKENNQPQRFFSKIVTYLAFALLWFSLMLSGFAGEIIKVLASNSNYWQAVDVVPVLVLSIVFIGIQRVFFFELQIPGKTQYIAIIVTAIAIINIILNLFFIPFWGMMGAAFATLLSYILSCGYAFHISRKYYPVRYELKRIFILFATAIILFFLTFIFEDKPLLLRIPGKALLILSFPFILYLTGFYEAVELDRIRGSVRKWTRIILRKSNSA